MKSAATAILKLYKGLVSPLLPPACRYVPTCSEYASEAVVRHGFLHGVALAAWRVLRCNPFAQGGYDPVPKD
jgi:putative membrane protein insertion efficiency factor